MSYLILATTAALIFAMAWHLRNQLHKTAPIRQALHEARNHKVLTGLHSIRRNVD